MKSFFSVLICVLTISCQNATKPATENQNREAELKAAANTKIVDNYLSALNKGDVAAMAEILADDCMSYGLGVKDSANTAKLLDGVKHHWEKYKYEGRRYKRIEAIALTTSEDGGRGRPKGDWVFEWGDVSIDYPASPDYGDVAVTATIAFHAAYRVRNGKIDRINNYFNHEDVMKQLGYKYLSVAEQKKVAHIELEYK